MENALSFSSFSLKDPFSVSHTSVSSSTNSEQSKLGVVSFFFLFGSDQSIVDSGELAQQCLSQAWQTAKAGSDWPVKTLDFQWTVLW